MTKAPANEVLWYMIYECSRSGWDKEIMGVDVCALEHAASSLSVIAGELAVYLMHRGAAGCGDHGHKAALTEAAKARKRLRKANGYSYP